MKGQSILFDPIWSPRACGSRRKSVSFVPCFVNKRSLCPAWSSAPSYAPPPALLTTSSVAPHCKVVFVDKKPLTLPIDIMFVEGQTGTAERMVIKQPKQPVFEIQ